jgi:threonine aldolase
VSAFRVDLRSDTVTKPSEAMRRAMAEAEVDDAWYGDDPTVNRLHERAAEITGHEAALFVASGTMANQIGLRLHVEGSGHLVACAAGSHVATTEVMTSTQDLARELLSPDAFYDVEVVDLLAVENTVGNSGGTVMPADELRKIRQLASEARVPMHLDGARIFNAAAAAGCEVTEWTTQVDTMMFCLSKGLGAPIGSIVLGPAEMIREARRLWILFGGAWRQAGILAAAGLLALEEGPRRLHEDHQRARRLAEGVAEVAPETIDLTNVETNMVLVDTEAMGIEVLEAASRMKEEGVGVTTSGGRLRMVTHLGISDEDVEAALTAWRSVVAVVRPGG